MVTVGRVPEKADLVIPVATGIKFQLINYFDLVFLQLQAYIELIMAESHKSKDYNHPCFFKMHN